MFDCDCSFIDFVHCRRIFVLLESPCNVVLGQDIITLIRLVTSIFSYKKILFDLCHVSQGQPRQESTPNLARYKTAVFSALWVQIALVVCYLPMGIVAILTPQKGPLPLSFYLAR